MDVRDVQPGLASGKVASCCFDLLYMEMIHYIVNSTDKPTTVKFKLEQMGKEIGQRLAERCSRGKTRFKDGLDAVKFLCKEIWSEVFGKPIDNLRTNRKGIFVLQDNEFQWLKRLAVTSDKDAATYHVVFPCGIIRGALQNLGFPCSPVHADISSHPACVFTITMTGAGK